ncbi:hypothetical protein [Pyrobaculum aerophilum]|uniref:Conserved within P. aerophilum n=2 Tax=Pyrobaculum aerophilum TaxID=13773 RepID=Q8ZTH9_PYRAE|nr:MULTISPECIES: hypothetical protein [Pyrobaculum]AAL64782.1 conserved within P. aerophilum [Pyrobaculum aerophilum str. IM2]MCX8136293.1 hypothetical protein [Pyrobaculum aerophilum]RFA94504.1 hypothetical protein CGL51_10060 [Pyrobaculum aerophilum]RFA99210.1 hypothetical protein CGL52_04210 [Pyrobaculum aerophilum]HII47608.1 hypothetical protein [Pyrobaculum aerophilum]
MELYFAFKKDPPKEWEGITGVKAVRADQLSSIEGKFVVVVGDRELAERLRVGYLSEEEAQEFLEFLKRKLAGQAQ